MILTKKEGVNIGQMSVAQALKQSPGEFSRVCLSYLVLIVFLCQNIVKADFSSLYRSAYP